MAEQWVVNASPLIVLAKIGHLHLLDRLTDDLIMPQSVLAEINAGPADDTARQALAASPWPVLPVLPAPIVLAWDLGAGETDALSYALTHAGWRAVIDDGAARRCARTLAIPHIGTLGVILRARQAGLVPAAVPLLQALQNHGFRLDDDVIRSALAETVGETWP